MVLHHIYEIKSTRIYLHGHIRQRKRKKDTCNQMHLHPINLKMTKLIPQSTIILNAQHIIQMKIIKW